MNEDTITLIVCLIVIFASLWYTIRNNGEDDGRIWGGGFANIQYVKISSFSFYMLAHIGKMEIFM